MHEKTRTASRRMVCDVCGRFIYRGERYRLVQHEYSLVRYREHIQCPHSKLAILPKPKLNHANMAVI